MGKLYSVDPGSWEQGPRILSCYVESEMQLQAKTHGYIFALSMLCTSGRHFQPCYPLAWFHIRLS